MTRILRLRGMTRNLLLKEEQVMQRGQMVRNSWHILRTRRVVLCQQNRVFLNRKLPSSAKCALIVMAHRPLSRHSPGSLVLDDLLLLVVARLRVAHKECFLRSGLIR